MPKVYVKSKGYVHERVQLIAGKKIDQNSLFEQLLALKM